MGGRRIEKLENLFREHYLPLCRWVYRIVRNTSDTVDIVQEAFLRYWTLDQTHSEGTRGPGFLYRTAQNLAVDCLRQRAVRQKRLEQLRGERVVVLPVTPEDHALASEKRHIVQAALRTLTERQRQCLELRACGLSYDDIAEVLNLSPESVGPTLTRALRKFRDAYERLQQSWPARREDAGAR